MEMFRWWQALGVRWSHSLALPLLCNCVTLRQDEGPPAAVGVFRMLGGAVHLLRHKLDVPCSMHCLILKRDRPLLQHHLVELTRARQRCSCQRRRGLLGL